MPIRDDRLVEQLLPDFFHRSSADASFAHLRTLIGGMPGLKSYFHMANPSTAGGLQTWQTLYPQDGGCVFGRLGWTHWAEFNGTGYLDTASIETDITGAETFIDVESRGLTIGGWVNPVAAAAGAGKDQTIIAKWDYSHAVNKAYILYLEGTDGTPTFKVSTDGVAETSMVGAGARVTLASGQWSFVAATYAPSNKMMIGVNGVWQETTASIPASIHNSSENLTIGNALSANGGDYGFVGKLSNVFLATYQYTDTEYLDVVYQLTAPIFGIHPRL